MSKLYLQIVTENDFVVCSIGKLSRLEALEKRNRLFSMEKKRQIDSVGRIEKIEVRYLGVPKDMTLFMNKDISTPFDCAKREIWICLTFVHICK